jgi:hypothetical protein
MSNGQYTSVKMLDFDNLKYFSNPHKVLQKVLPILSKSTNIEVTDEISTNYTYLTVGPWKYSKERQKVFDKGHFIHYDKGYFFNTKAASTFRLSYNNLQESYIFDHDDKRISNYNIDIKPWKKQGDYILIVAPDEFPIKYYTEFNNEYEWTSWLKHELRKYTDRKIFIRYKETRKLRTDDPFVKYLDNAFAVITHQSLACIESICEGVPVFNLAPSCCDNMALQDISKIEQPFYPDNRWEWIKSLSYGQFSIEELENGFAINQLKERYL